MKSLLPLVLLVSSVASAQFPESYEANRTTENLSGTVLSVRQTVYGVDSLDTNHLISDGEFFISDDNAFFQFDKRGNLVQKIAFFHGDTSSISLREFNASNKIVHAVYRRVSDGETRMDQVTDYSYDPEGRMILETRSKGQKRERSQQFTYDRYSRQMVGKDQYLFNNPVGKAGDTIVYSMEKTGELVAVYYNRLRELKHQSDYEVFRYDTLGRMTSDSVYTPDHKFESVDFRRYDTQNRLVVLIRAGIGKTTYTLEHTYDSYGNEIRLETKKNGEPLFLDQTSYVLDDHSNWIVKRISQNGWPAYVVRREIVYAD